MLVAPSVHPVELEAARVGRGMAELGFSQMTGGESNTWAQTLQGAEQEE